MVRAPVTPTSDTQYRNPPLRAATAARRSGDVVGATRYTTPIPASQATRSNGAPSSGVRSATITPDAPAAASASARSRPSPPPISWFA